MAKQKRICYPRAVGTKACRVSVKDLDGVRHRVEVQADSLYEAAVLGLKALNKGSCVAEIGAGHA